MEDWKQWRERTVPTKWLVALQSGDEAAAGGWLRFLMAFAPEMSCRSFMPWKSSGLAARSSCTLSSYASDVSVNARLTDRLSVGLNAYFGGRTALELGYLTC